ncbi:hypothetical protein L345_18131, partial [Ophiophagus hannah]
MDPGLRPPPCPLPSALRLEGLPCGLQAPPSALGPPGLQEEETAELQWVEWQTERETERDRSPLAERSEQTGSLTMCTGMCSRLVGLVLVATALACMAANILLFFPNAEGQWTPDHITTQAWLMGGVFGGGLMVSGPDGADGASPPGGPGCRARGQGWLTYWRWKAKNPEGSEGLQVDSLRWGNTSAPLQAEHFLDCQGSGWSWGERDPCPTCLQALCKQRARE